MNVKLLDRKEYGILYSLGSAYMWTTYIVWCLVFILEHLRAPLITMRLFIILPDSMTTCSPWLLSRCSEIQTLGLGYKEEQHIKVPYTLLC